MKAALRSGDRDSAAGPKQQRVVGATIDNEERPAAWEAEAVRRHASAEVMRVSPSG
jgi:hypothetical protein